MGRTARRVLAVDDNPINLAIVAEILSEGYQLKFAESGPHAVQIARKFKPQVILLDVMMPDPDGPETVARLRLRPETRDIPVVLLTATSRMAASGGTRDARIDGNTADAIVTTVPTTIATTAVRTSNTVPPAGMSIPKPSIICFRPPATTTPAGTSSSTGSPGPTPTGPCCSCGPRRTPSGPHRRSRATTTPGGARPGRVAPLPTPRR